MNRQQRRQGKIKRRERRNAHQFPNEVWLPKEFKGAKLDVPYKIMRELVKNQQEKE